MCAPLRAAVTATVATAPPKCGTKASAAATSSTARSQMSWTSASPRHRVGARGRRLIWTRTAHARGRYPRRGVRVDEHTIYLDESPVFYRRSAEVPDVPALYLHGIPTSSDDWVEFLAPDRRARA